MADTGMGLGAFASGLANGWQMGMKMQDKQSGADQAKNATEQKQAVTSTNAGQAPTGQTAATGQGGVGLPSQPAQPAQPSQAAAAQGGSSPWSFIGSLFGGGNG